MLRKFFLFILIIFSGVAGFLGSFLVFSFLSAVIGLTIDKFSPGFYIYGWLFFIPPGLAVAIWSAWCCGKFANKKLKRKIHVENKNILLDTIIEQAKWKQTDHYPSCPEWKAEDNKLLELAKEERVLEDYFHRLTTDNKSRRDETLNELRAAYFLRKGCKISIKKWFPNNGRGEFTLFINGQDVFCEVKSPGWEAVEEESRKKQPKYIHAEVKTVDNSPNIIYTVKKAYVKFSDKIP
ncbi:MAG: hypothetical protein WC450_10295, partial [Candidatus Omnitrophota bacterium]